jgi:hypothetical protein
MVIKNCGKAVVAALNFVGTHPSENWDKLKNALRMFN